VQSLVAGKPALESDLGDDPCPAVVRVQLLERAVGIAPADAAEAEDLVEPLGLEQQSNLK
jgi:hypothetical protein